VGLMTRQGRAPSGHRTNKSTIVAFSVLAVALWLTSCTLGVGFLGGSAAPRVTQSALRRQSADGAVARRAYAFDIAESAEHDGLVVSELDGNKRVSTHGSLTYGQWNTVLGDTEIPSKGRSYFEVKIVRKPTEAWEYIGVAEASSDVTKPLTKNKKGAGWFWGGTWTQSFLYYNQPCKKEWNDKAKQSKDSIMKDFSERTNTPEKDFYYVNEPSSLWTGDAAHLGIHMEDFPPFEQGVVVGVDVDMDEGSVGFWADGKFLGKMKEAAGNLVDVKGKKLVPALSVFGRTTGGVNEYSVMEVRSGLEPPAKP